MSRVIIPCSTGATVGLHAACLAFIAGVMPPDRLGRTVPLQASRQMRQDIQKHSAWVTHIETSYTPSFIRQLIDYIRPEFPGFPVGLINIVNFNRYGWNLGS